MYKLKSLLPAIIFCCVTSLSYAQQQQLARSRHASYYTYITKIDNKQARSFYFKDTFRLAKFFSPVDSFPTDSDYNKTLPDGNYLFTHVSETYLHTELKLQYKFKTLLAPVHNELAILVLDEKGQPVTNARVAIDEHVIHYDSAKHWYSLRKPNVKSGVLTVEVGNCIEFKDITREYNNSWGSRILNRIRYSFPVKQICMIPNAIRRMFDDDDYSYRYGYREPEEEENGIYYKYGRSVTGYMDFNKPMYHPHDTVKLKAFLVNKKGKPLTKKLDIGLLKNDYEHKAVFSVPLKPITPGAYVFQFPLGDTMELDNHYTMQLSYKKGHTVYILRRGEFNYRDYQLDETHYKATLDKKEYKTGDTIAFHLRGADANGLPLLDARVKISVIKNSLDDFYNDSIYANDTLWHYECRLADAAETKLVIPDSLLPAINAKYTALITFNNSNNESHDTAIDFSLDKYSESLFLSLTDTSIVATHRGAIPKDDEYTLEGFGNSKDESIFSHTVTFPHSEKINPLVAHYELSCDHQTVKLDMDDEEANTDARGFRTPDSVFFRVSNPRKINMHYTIFKNHTELTSGNISSNLAWKIADRSKNSYIIRCTYTWKGQAVEITGNASYFDKNLTIDIKQPPVINPGEKVNVTIDVKDFKGNAVKDVNLTAACINAQFKNANVPDLPYLGKVKKYIPYYNSYYISSWDNYARSQRVPVDAFCRKRLGLDTISYYKAIYPDKGLYLQYDSIGKADAQFAPYVFNKGLAEPISSIYLDDTFVYYYDVYNRHPFSFKASPGYHTINIRLEDKWVIIDSVKFRKNCKLQLCVDYTKPNCRIHVIPTTKYLSEAEARDVNHSIFSVRYALGYNTYYIWQDKNIHILTNPGYSYNTEDVLKVGPFKEGLYIHYAEQNGFNQTFPFESGYSYEVRYLNTLVMREITKPDKIYLHNNTSAELDFADRANADSNIILTVPEKVRDMYSPFLSEVPYRTEAGKGTCTFQHKTDSSIYAVIMQRDKDDTVNRWIFNGGTSTIYNLAPGEYYFRFVTTHKYYFTCHAVIRANSTFCRILKAPVMQKLNPADPLNRILFSPDHDGVKSLNRGYSFGSGSIKVHLMDKNTRQPLPFCNVVVEQFGMQVSGGVTDIDGYCAIKELDPGVYQIKAVSEGYQDAELRDVSVYADKISYRDIAMVAESMKLSCVMIVRDKAPLISSNTQTGQTVTKEDYQHMAVKDINSVAACTAGIYQADMGGIPAKYGDATGGIIAIRGARSDVTEYIIDGVKVSADSPLLKSKMDSITAEDKNAKSLRNNYADYAYWVPNLITDNKGEASFSATFPDNITKWNTHVLGMDDKKHSGTGYAFTRSFKKLSAQLETPRFLVAGDETDLLGKAFNYTSSSYPVKTKFIIGSNAISKDTSINKALFQKQSIIAGSSDSLTATYSVSLDNGYSDGEKRSIPIYPKGVPEKVGSFMALQNDTALSLPFDRSKGTVYLHMAATPADLFLRDIEWLREYPYECNEQMSSKLLGLLAEKQIKAAKGEKFTREKELVKFIERLTKNQHDRGSWGWWGTGSASPWMTCYVLNALSKAKQAGYNIYCLNKGYSYLKEVMSVCGKSDKLYALKILSEAKETMEYDTLLKHFNPDSLSLDQLITYEKVRQNAGLNYNINKVLDKKKQTLMGNIYWAGSEWGWYDNAMSESVAAFELLRDDSTHSYLCEKVFNYFLEERRYAGLWMNTVQTATLLNVLTPYVLAKHKLNNTKPKVELATGVYYKTVVNFPFTDTLSTTALRVNKTGGAPVYFTAYQKVFNPDPKKIDTRYNISTHFLSNGKTSDTISSGEPLTLVVDVDVKLRSDYMMLSVPIPAGCSYGDNEHTYNYNEVHREQYKDRTNIYCELLYPWHYEYRINLQARYTGKYTLNSAQMESMYFPTLNGRNETRRVRVK